MTPSTSLRSWRAWPWLAALLLSWMAGAAFAQAQGEADPPGRVGYLSYAEGGVVFAPQGEDEWIDLPHNRPLTVGDRLWTDRGARAELQVGSATVHLAGESHLGVSDLDERAAQFILQQGTANVRVRDLAQGENFEVDTPNLALRAAQPGDYRIDVDAATGTTRVVVQSGTVTLFGEGGQPLHMGAGQQASFAGRFLAQVQEPPFRQDEFAAWAQQRNRIEDQSQAARYVPRGVVGYSQLDRYGQWGSDPAYGAVWYPQVPVADWAPYRYGHWEWIGPWGWTWIDDAPWGFAPFHYGRWTMIGQRWAWVPGRMAARPVYSPALVVFMEGGAGLSMAAGPGVGWYPLAPGEAWYPVYRTSPRYVNYVNFNINLNAYPRNFRDHYWARRPYAVTAVPQDVFRRGQPVYRNWHGVQPGALGQAHFNVVPPRPDFRRQHEAAQPRLQSAPPTAQQGLPQRFFGGGGRQQPPAAQQQGAPQHAFGGREQPPSAQQQGAPQRFFGGREQPSSAQVQSAPQNSFGGREQAPGQRQPWNLQRDADRAAREQIQQQEQARQQQDPRWQREQLLRQQQEQAGRIPGERGQREAQPQLQQRQQQEQFQRQREQQLRAQQEQMRSQQEQARRQNERVQRDAMQQQRQAEQMQRIQQERAQREAWQRQREAERPQPRAMVVPQQVQPVMQPPVQRMAPPPAVVQHVQPQAAPPQAAQVQPAPRGYEGRGQRGEENGAGPGPGGGHWRR